MSVDPLQAAKVITQLSGKTLAAGHAAIAAHGTKMTGRVAVEQGNRVVAAAQADLAQRAVERWLELLYERDGDVWYNVREDGLIVLAPPWSRSRRRNYGLTEPQARLLLRIARHLIDQLPERRQLYWFVDEHRRYALNRSRFPTYDVALEWQRTLGAISPALWHAFSNKYPGGRI